MEYLFLISLLAIVALFAVSPFLCYKRTGKQFIEFYIWMASLPKARRIYRITFSMSVTLFNYLVLDLTGPNPWMIPGMILSVFLLTDKCTAAIFRWLHDDRRIQGLAFSVFLLTLALPQLFTLSISIGMLIIAAFFYPSWGLTLYMEYPEEFEKNEKLKNVLQYKNLFIMHMYFISIRAPKKLAYLDS